MWAGSLHRPGSYQLFCEGKVGRTREPLAAVVELNPTLTLVRELGKGVGGGGGGVLIQRICTQAHRWVKGLARFSYSSTLADDCDIVPVAVDK